ncbi:MAG: AAA family ATPase [Acidobacteria bacterium]|nr:AAA family ATPase [Acidobacteriota bacterium]
MLRQFTIKGFKRFRDATSVDLEDITLLVGVNNSGKSTILQALTLFQYCIEITRKYNGNGRRADDLVLASRTTGFEEFGVVPAAHPGDLWPDGLITRKSKPRPISLKAAFTNGSEIEFQIRISYNRFSIQPSAKGPWQEAVHRREIRLIPIFAGFLPQEEYLTPPARQDRLRLQRHGETIRNQLWHLQQDEPQRWRKLQELLAELFPESTVDVDFNLDIDRFLKATYKDQALRRRRDVITSGSGFHQALQILASVLTPGAAMFLLDEPDAHLHARLQGQLMAILERLAREEGEQFVLATHSPQLLNAAPSGSIRVCMAGQAVPFTVQPDQLLLLSDLGAMDQMELVPLLVNRVVVFVENKSDRKLLEAFARKHWGAKKQQAIWRHLTFLYTYQGPIEARVLDLARQVRDIVTSPGIESGVTTRFLAIGDRDYRTNKTRLRALRDRNATAKSDAYKLDFRLVLWEENEVENYLLDLDAILRALDSNAAVTAKKTAWRRVRRRFIREWERRLGDQREHIWVRVAERIQQEDRRLSLTTAMGQAQEEVALEDANLAHWCDAKKVLSGLRGWLQQEGFPFHLTQEEVIHHMNTVPPDVQRTLRLLQRLRPKRRRSAVAKS